MTVKLQDFTHENTQQYTGETFTLLFDNGLTIELVLERVTAMMEKHVHPRMTRDTFAWHLRGPRTPLLPQNTYVMSNEKLGQLKIFIVPIEAAHDHAIYEAIFN